MAYDQLSDRIGPLAHEDPEGLGVILIENPSKAARRPYHQQKIAYVLANQRRFALEQAERGVAVDYRVGSGSYGEILGRRPGTRMMEPAEWELRQELIGCELEFVPHEGWLTTPAQFRGKPPWRMDAFYRRVRQDSGFLMVDGRPVGGKYSFDAENRRPWKGQPPAPQPPNFAGDPVKDEVCELIRRNFANHPGELHPETLPSTAADAQTLWRWAMQECLPYFGPYEDAMSTRSSGLFHSRTSPLINLHRLLPREVVTDVLAAEHLPLACREGFLRQVLGWREFVRHVHRETEGFRTVTGVAEQAGDGGFRHWTGQSWPGSSEAQSGADPMPDLNSRELPPAYWGVASGLNCLDTVVADVWREGWSHHITRLMVLSNLANLLDVSPRQLTDWFWVAYIDAYDWVVEPNVLAMGTFAVGELMTTKPYVAGAAYIDKMSDYCRGCRYDPKKNCPITGLYWAYLERHRERFQSNHRMGMMMLALSRRSEAKKAEDRQTYERIWEQLQSSTTPPEKGTQDSPVKKVPLNRSGSK